MTFQQVCVSFDDCRTCVRENNRVLVVEGVHCLRSRDVMV